MSEARQIALNDALVAANYEEARSILTSKSLFGGKVNMNYKNERNGRTPLHYALEGGSIKCVILLLQHGADLTITDNEGNPILFVL